MATTVVYETHSTTRDNERGVATGWLPGRLSAAGRRQAAELGRRRGDDGLAAVIHSDLARAVETAGIAFAGSGIPRRGDARLRECDYGELGGGPAAGTIGDRARFVDVPHPGGESYRQAVARHGELLAEVAAEFDGRRVLLVGHRATFYALEHLVLGRDLSEVVTAPYVWRPGWTYRVEAHGR